MNKIKLSAIALLLSLSACGGEQAEKVSEANEESDKELYNAVNEPLEKAKEVEDILKQATEDRNKELEQQSN